MSIPDPPAFLRQLFDHAAAALPMRCVPAAHPPEPPGRMLVVGAGKAFARIAETGESAWGRRWPRLHPLRLRPPDGRIGAKAVPAMRKIRSLNHLHPLGPFGAISPASGATAAKEKPAEAPAIDVRCASARSS